MPTFAADPGADLDREAAERRTRDAWLAYHEHLRDLTGREYEDAEPAAWDQLQRDLGAAVTQHIG